MNKKSQILTEVTIKAKQTILTDDEKLVIDYNFIGNDLIVLQKENTIKNRKSIAIISVNLHDTIAISKNLPAKSKSIFCDCLGSYHLVTNDSAYQLLIDTGSIQFFPPVDKFKFNSVLQDCLFEYGDYIIFRSSLKNDFGEEYFAVNTLSTITKSILFVIDSSMFSDYINSHLYIASKYWGHEIPAASVENDSLLLDNIRMFESTKRFYDKIIFNPVNNFLFDYKGEIIFFNHVNSKIQIFSDEFEIINEIPILYNLEKNWQNDILFDRGAGKFYTIISESQFYDVYEINIQTGKIGFVSRIPYLYPEKIKVNNNIIFFLAKSLSNRVNNIKRLHIIKLSKN